MDARAVVVFLGLATVAGVALASVRRDAQPAGGAIDAPPGEGGGDWGPIPDLADEAASFFEDAMGSVTGDKQAMSWDGLQHLADFEGFSAVPYWDFKGCSIGFGHLIQPGETLTYVTRDDAMVVLGRDVADAERAVRTAVTVPLSQNQFDALTSFAYNVGAGAFRKSTLLRLLNAGDYAGAAAQLPRWKLAGGKPLAALDTRRQAERTLFEA